MFLRKDDVGEIRPLLFVQVKLILLEDNRADRKRVAGLLGFRILRSRIIHFIRYEEREKETRLKRERKKRVRANEEAPGLCPGPRHLV